MNQLTVALISFSIVIPLVVGLVQIKKMDRAHYPFLLYLGLGACNELLSFFLIRSGYSNAISGNIYLLLAGLLLTYQFKRWRLFQASRVLYVFILLLLTFTWTAETFVLGSIRTFASHYIVVYAFVIVLMSITMINKVMAIEKRSLLKNPIFLICAGLVLFYTCAVIVEAAYIYSLKFSLEIQKIIIRTMSLILLLTNLLYTLALIWMPRRRSFSFSY